MKKIKEMRFSYDEIKTFIKQSNLIENEKPIIDPGSTEALEILLNLNEEQSQKKRVELIMKAHYALMKRTKFKFKNYKKTDIGKIRNKNVFVGGEMCPEVKDLDILLNKWVDHNFSTKTINHLLLKHKEFELIHPFIDGNGRLGRLLFLVDLNATKMNFKYFPNSIKNEYYKLFKTKYLKDIKSEKILRKDFFETDLIYDKILRNL